MLYVFHGEQFWLNQKLAELEIKAREKNCDVLKFEAEDSPPLNSFLSRDLFGKKLFLILKDFLKEKERVEEIKALSRDLAESENIIVICENEITEAWHKVFEKGGAKIQEFKKATGAKLSGWILDKGKEAGLDLSKRDVDILIDQADSDPATLLNKIERISLERRMPVSKSKSIGGNYFNFADAVSGKRKAQALSLLRSYMRDGFGAEEAFWKLWWKVKTLRLVDSGKKSTGLHPFVEKKALQDLQNFSPGELKKLSFNLLDIFSNARRGEESFEDGLERTILKM